MMPGVSRGEMNGGYRDFEHGHLRSSSYANGYNPYGKENFGGPPRRYNGADDLEHNSFEMREGRDPTYEVDHLATYTNKSGITNPEDGLTKLKQMESTTGIWTMRCSLIIERFHIVIIDKGNGDELERFPMANVYEPTAVLKNDNKETYNNLLLFTILDDPRRKNSSSDMHIFQSINAPAHNIVDEILRAKGDSGSRREPEAFIPPPPRVPAPEPPYIGRSTGTYLGGGGVLSQTRAGYAYRDDMDTGQNEVLERDVQLLNNCFDDIEKFVSRLQQAAEAYKELERRRNERGGGKKKKGGGDGMLMMRARPPPADDFVDIFQKFKFAFNLLAKLKAHIHDPNAPELVHFLFTPLSLIYEASRDPIHGGRDLSLEAVAPLLLPEAKQLLTNCLTSKELELWTRLGRPWTLVKNEWNGPVPNYNPRFYNGWTPSPQLVDEVNVPGGGFREDQILRTSERVPYLDARRDDPRRDDPYRDTRRDDPYSRREEPFRDTRREDPYRDTRLDGPYRDTRRDDPYRETARDDPYSRDIRREEPYRDTRQEDPRREPAYSKSIPRREEQDRDDYPTTSFVTIWEKRAGDPPPAAPKTRAELNLAFAQDLKRMGATIYEAGHERQGKNPKELTVEKGDILQVLDKSRNWWKLKNYSGESGYAPYTILKEYQGGDAYDHNPGDKRRLSGDYNSGFINGGGPPPAPPIMGGLGRSTNRNEGDGSFRYF